jgi:hypothetical protein
MGEKNSIETSKMDKHWEKVRRFKGQKPPLNNIIGCYIRDLRDWNGFVVDYPEFEMREKFKSLVVPLVVKSKFGIQDRTAVKKIRHLEDVLGTENIMILAVRTDEVSEGWWIGPVLEADLSIEKPETLLDQSLKASAKGEYELSEAKQLAYLAITENQSLN